MAQRLRHKITFDGQDAYIFGATLDILNFFPTADPVAEEQSQVKSIPFKGSTRRRFPGGPTYSAGGGTRKVVIARPASQTTLPGNPIKCEISTGTGRAKITTVKQFTLQGPFRIAHEVAKAHATEDFVLRSPGGKPYKIGANVGP
jgi:hypothetical protein